MCENICVKILWNNLCVRQYFVRFSDKLIRWCSVYDNVAS